MMKIIEVGQKCKAKHELELFELTIPTNMICTIIKNRKNGKLNLVTDKNQYICDINSEIFSYFELI